MNARLEVFQTIVPVTAFFCAILITPKRSIVFKTSHFSTSPKQKQSFKRVLENKCSYYMCIIAMYAIKIQGKQGVDGIFRKKPLIAAFEIKAVLKNNSH